MNLVDGRGEEVKLLGCPHPVKNTGSSMSSPEDFEKFVETTKHERSASDFRPGTLNQSGRFSYVDQISF